MHSSPYPYGSLASVWQFLKISSWSLCVCSCVGLPGAVSWAWNAGDQIYNLSSTDTRRLYGLFLNLSLEFFNL